MSAKANYINCSHCSMPVHVPQKQQQTPNLDKIVNLMQSLPLSEVYALIILIKKVDTQRFKVTITRTGQETWNLSIDVFDKFIKVLLSSNTCEGFDKRMLDDAEVCISDPRCISHYIEENCICSINVRN